MCREICYLEGRNAGNIEKSVYFSCKSWILASFKQPERNTLGHLHIHYDNSFCPLFELPERYMLHALGSHYLAQFYRTRLLTTGMAVNTPRTLPTELSQHSPLNSLRMEWGSLSLGSLTQLSNYSDIYVHTGFGA